MVVLTLDHPSHFNSLILYLCSFLFSFFKSCLFARWTDCSKWITVLYLHLRWSCICISVSMQGPLLPDICEKLNPICISFSMWGPLLPDICEKLNHICISVSMQGPLLPDRTCQMNILSLLTVAFVNMGRKRKKYFISL